MFRRGLSIYKRPGFPAVRFFCNPVPKEKCFVIKSSDQEKKILYANQILKQFQDQQLKEQKKLIASQDLGVRKLAMMSWEQVLAVTRTLFKKRISKASALTENRQVGKISETAVAKDNLECWKFMQFKDRFQFAFVNETLMKATEKFRLFVEKSWEQLISVIRQSNFQDKMSEAKKALKEKANSEEMKKLPEKLKEQWKLVLTSKAFNEIEKIPRKISETSKTALARGHHQWEIFMKSEFKDQLVKTTFNVVQWSCNKGKVTVSRVHKFIYEAYFEDPQPLKIQKKPKAKQ